MLWLPDGGHRSPAVGLINIVKDRQSDSIVIFPCVAQPFRSDRTQQTCTFEGLLEIQYGVGAIYRGIIQAAWLKYQGEIHIFGDSETQRNKPAHLIISLVPELDWLIAPVSQPFPSILDASRQ